jgi:hypothetical protein
MSRDDYEFGYDECDEEGHQEPRTAPDMWIGEGEKCGVCGVTNSTERPMRNACSECGVATHDECGADCEPSGGWDRDDDVNYWVCDTCLAKANAGVATYVSVQGEDALSLEPFHLGQALFLCEKLAVRVYYCTFYCTSAERLYSFTVLQLTVSVYCNYGNKSICYFEMYRMQKDTPC